MPKSIVSPATLVASEIVRQANTTAYSLGDIITTASPSLMLFANMARLPGGTGAIPHAKLFASGMAATVGNFDLHLYSGSFVPDADNAPFGPNWDGVKQEVAKISFDESGGTHVYHAMYDEQNLSVVFKCATTTTALWGAIEARNAYTPASGGTLTVQLGVLQD